MSLGVQRIDQYRPVSASPRGLWENVDSRLGLESLGWGPKICLLTNSQVDLRHRFHNLCRIIHCQRVYMLLRPGVLIWKYKVILSLPTSLSPILGQGPISCLQNSSDPGLKWTCWPSLFPGTSLAELNCPHNFACVGDGVFSVAPLV